MANVLQYSADGVNFIAVPAGNVINVPDSVIDTTGLLLRYENQGCNSTPVQAIFSVPVFNTDDSVELDCAALVAAFASMGLVYNTVTYTDQATFIAAVLADYPTDSVSYNATTCEFEWTVGLPPFQVLVSTPVALPVATISNTYSGGDTGLFDLPVGLFEDDGVTSLVAGDQARIIVQEAGGTILETLTYNYGDSAALGTGGIGGAASAVNFLAGTVATGSTLIFDKRGWAIANGLQGLTADVNGVNICLVAIDGGIQGNPASTNVPMMTRPTMDNTTFSQAETVILDPTYGPGYQYVPFPDVGSPFEFFPVGGTYTTDVLTDGWVITTDTSRYEINDTPVWFGQDVRWVEYTQVNGNVVTGPGSIINLGTNVRGRLRLVWDDAGQNMPFGGDASLPLPALTEGTGGGPGDFNGSIWRNTSDDFEYNLIFTEIVVEILTGPQTGAFARFRPGDHYVYRY